MSRKTLIFGNGLGMSLNPAHFSLDSAIGKVWDSADFLDGTSKKLICDCLPNEGSERPHGEHDFDVLQLALSACEFLSRIGLPSKHWLSQQGLVFPRAVRKFVQQVALHFHKSGTSLPKTFLQPLASFLIESKSHVAMLNYDNLLYSPLIQAEVLDGFNGALVDGFLKNGFDPANLERKGAKSFGYYLHLHGSPLFVGMGNKITKKRQIHSDHFVEGETSHIVLTHFKHKVTVISGSDLLTTYWRKFEEALAESSEIVIVGYKGEDEHLNAVLHKTPAAPVRVVEWTGAGEGQSRQAYWNSLLLREVTLIRMPNILDFTDWSRTNNTTLPQ